MRVSAGKTRDVQSGYGEALWRDDSYDRDALSGRRSRVFVLFLAARYQESVYSGQLGGSTPVRCAHCENRLRCRVIIKAVIRYILLLFYDDPYFYRF